MRALTYWFGRRAVLAVAFAVLLSACESDPTSDSTVLVVSQTTQPMLTSSRDRDITLFGGLPRRGDRGYIGRSRGSLLQHSFTNEGGDFDCLLDATGQRFAFASTRHSETPDIYIKSVSGTAVMQLTSDPSSDAHPAMSPDGRRVAFASDRTGNWDIWVVDIDGRQPIQITNTMMEEVHPSWSPDGTRVVYSARAASSGQWELWIAPAIEHSTSTFIGYGVFPEWSPIGDKILFQRARQRGARWYSVWTLEIVDGEPRYPTEVAASADYAMILPSWSRDGRRIAYTTVGSLPSIDPEFGDIYEKSDIWVMDADGGSRVRLTDGHSVNFGPSWSPDGRVFFSSARSGHVNIWSALPSTGAPRGGSPITAAGGSPQTVMTSSRAGE